MPETINWLEEEKAKTLLGWLIVEAATDEVMEADDFDASKVLLELRINGVEVPVREAFEFANSQHDALIRREAVKLLDERFGELGAKAEEILQILSEATAAAQEAVWGSSETGHTS